MDTITFYQWLCLLGVPTIVGMVIGYFVSKLAKTKNEINALRYGVQALLRCELRQQYEVYSRQGWASVDTKEDFVNMYKWYHNLGENGVMDDVYRKFLALPTSPTTD